MLQNKRTFKRKKKKVEGKGRDERDGDEGRGFFLWIFGEKAMEGAGHWGAGTCYPLHARSSCLFAWPSQWLSLCG